MARYLTVGDEICVRRHIVCSLESVSTAGASLAGGSIQAGGSLHSGRDIGHGAGHGVSAGSIRLTSIVPTERRTSPSADVDTPVSGAGDVT